MTGKFGGNSANDVGANLEGLALSDETPRWTLDHWPWKFSSENRDMI